MLMPRTQGYILYAARWAAFGELPTTWHAIVRGLGVGDWLVHSAGVVRHRVQKKNELSEEKKFSAEAFPRNCLSSGVVRTLLPKDR